MIGTLTQICCRKSLGLLFLGIGLLFMASPRAAAYRVTDLDVSTTPQGAAVTIEADAPLSYSYFTIGEPECRLVVDFSDAVHGLPKYRFDNLENQLISRIRTSQYRPYPQPSVRIVLDMPRLVPFHMKDQANKVVILLETPSKGDLGAEEPVQTSSQVPDRGDAKVQTPSEDVGAQVPTVEMEAQTPAEVSDRAGEEHSMAPATGAEDSIGSGGGKIDSEEPEKTAASQLSALGFRKPVSYSSGGRRDPFVQLPGGQEVEFGQAPLPNVEKLTIVGILLGTDGYRALAQDDAQNGYVLRKGDRVLYGYVAQIEEQRVVFRLDRRGLDKTVILKLPQ